MKLLYFLCIVSIQVLSQSFQSPTNTYYWKNKISEKSEYWQQDIDYTIDARLDENLEIISGNEKIIYTNNSPHTIHELFFNLYQNAFIKNSYLSNLQEANGERIHYGKWEAEGKGNEIISIKVDGQPVKTEIDGSIMKAWLYQPMAPNSKITIDIIFKTYYSKGGQTRRRMKSYVYQGVKHFNGAHWYPRLAVYDRKFGWCTDQHLNREFYGDFGTYRVQLDMPANFVVEATGVLQNREDVLPDSLRKKLDISNYWSNPWDTAVTYFIPTKIGERKVWKYLGENVHDFAWVAGPHYRIDEKKYKGYSTVALVLEPHCSGWKNACDFSHKVIDVYSRDFGQYAYPKMVVADCQDGMEYPMLTMDGGSDPGYRGLLAHEIGHNWFYGMVNNNETYRAMLDEGFTQFLTVWALEAIDGKDLFNPGKKGKFYMPTAVRDARCYNSFMFDAMQRDKTEINVHSDGFNGATGQGGGYRNVYNKTATMLYNLQYVLGDTLFQNAMKHYFNQWSFRHPYIEDFKNSIIEYTKVDLNWFFDQWIETSKVIDYKIFPLKKLNETKYQLKLQRKEEMQMPLDIAIVGKSGKRYNFYIPNTWFEKKTNATTLPRWIGWDNKLKTTYKTEIQLPEAPEYAQIDTSRRLADVNELDNTTQSPWRFIYDSERTIPRDREHYSILWRPNLWYNNFDGIKIGGHFEGSLNSNFRQSSLDFWINTGIGKWAIRDTSNLGYQSGLHDLISFQWKYQTPTPKFIKNSSLTLEARHLDGIALGRIGIRKSHNNFTQSELSLKSMLRYRTSQDNYNYNDIQWNRGKFLNTSIEYNLNYTKPIYYQWYQQTKLSIRSAFLSMADYSYLSLEHKENFFIDRCDIRWRFYGRLGINDNSFIATESMLNVGGANGEEMLESEFMRSVSFFPSSFTPYDGMRPTHLHYGGGLNIRGYSFAPIIYDQNQQPYQLSNQNTGTAINAEIHLENYSPIKSKKLNAIFDMELYLFGDMGTITSFDPYHFEMTKNPWLYDAGVGSSLTWKKFGFSTIQPLTLRFDMPLYLSLPFSSDNGENFKFRWMIGIDKAF